MSHSVVINIKTEPVTKRRAQKVAQDLGLSLSGLINAYLKQLARTKTVTFSAVDEEPTEYLLRALEESRDDVKAGRVSPSFTNAKEAVTWLNNPRRKYAREI